MTQANSPRLSEQGFVIVAVLWLVAALAALALVFSIYLSNSARALALGDTAAQTEALVSAGVELAAYQLQLAAEESRPAQGAFRIRIGSADLAISYVSEAARIDLNAAPKELIAGLLSVLGAGEDEAREGADRIVAWRTRSTPESAGNEDALYRAAGRSYSPRQAPFVHINELGLVLGLSPALVERALPFVTVFSGASGVDVLTAAPEVIASLPGMTPLILKAFLDERSALPDDKTAIAAALGTAAASASQQRSRAYRILVRIRLPNGRENASDVVIVLRNDEEPYRVLSWQDVTASFRARRSS
ncbi:type II secretion system protein GspK [Bradyrhizobium sp. NP1]|uniref:general secretion pathway protein GspK n=1 Tax=Bradyrhizobium sp. NP1 TaxID=3049772 RepID=UPI0025A62966|nr:type II secretion system protein GspK [Bradyrhizobium sp. NP1]WJR79991.1 type II secretion system protein GspK [Bradyrhizobium sp. NP1]